MTKVALFFEFTEVGFQLPCRGDLLKLIFFQKMQNYDCVLNFQVAEKNVLPSAEDLKQEKLHEGVFKGVEGFTPDKLKPTTTREAASPLDVAKTELARDKTADELKDFDKNKLKQVECQEKNPLPDADSKSCKPQYLCNEPEFNVSENF